MYIRKNTLNIPMNIKSILEPNNGRQINSLTDMSDKVKSVDGKYLNIVWEGSQFIYHSFALVNREICKNIANSGIRIAQAQQSNGRPRILFGYALGASNRKCRCVLVDD